MRQRVTCAWTDSLLNLHGRSGDSGPRKSLKTQYNTKVGTPTQEALITHEHGNILMFP